MFVDALDESENPPGRQRGCSKLRSGQGVGNRTLDEVVQLRLNPSHVQDVRGKSDYLVPDVIAEPGFYSVGRVEFEYLLDLFNRQTIQIFESGFGDVSDRLNEGCPRNALINRSAVRTNIVPLAPEKSRQSDGQRALRS